MNTSFDRLARWRDKVVLVTGATSGIGRVTALALGSIGMKVAITGRRGDRLDALSHDLRSLGAETLTLQGDQTQRQTNYDFFRQVRDHWGGVDVLVNNAGVTGGGPFIDGDLAVFQNCLDLNLQAAAICLQEAVHDMRDREPAAIIVISSMTAYRLIPGRTSPAYAATKQALRVLTEGVRIELAQARSRAKVAMISPGLVATEFHQHSDYPYQPLQPEDIVEAVLYILSTPSHVQVCDVLIRSVEQVQ